MLSPFNTGELAADCREELVDGLSAQLEVSVLDLVLALVEDSPPFTWMASPFC